MIFSPVLLLALCVPALFIIASIVMDLSATSSAYSIRKTRKYGRGFADLLSYAALIRPTIILNKDGALMSAWEFRGQDASTLDYTAMRRRVAHINSMFRKKDKGWMFHCDMIRKASPELELPSYLRTNEERVLAESRVKHASQRFENKFYLAVTYLPSTDANTKRANVFMDVEEGIEVSIERTLEIYERGLAQIEDELSTIMKLRRLGDNGINLDDGIGTNSELLSVLVEVIYGYEQPITIGEKPLMLSALLGAHDMVGGFKPRIGNKHLGVLNITGFPSTSYPGILEKLQTVNAAFRFSTRIVIEDQFQARKKIDESYRIWFGARTGLAAKAMSNAPGRVNRDADRMADDAEAALETLDRGSAHFVYYTAKIVFHADSALELDDAKREVTKAISQMGFLVRDESMNAIEAYLGSLWGDGYHDLRKYMLHTLNIGDLMLTFAVWKGREKLTCDYCPDEIEPVGIVKTTGGADFAFDPHLKDIMHVFSVGASGTGKTTLINYLNSNFARTPDSQIIGIDFGYGMYTPCLFLGGDHIDPRGLDGSFRFSLFSNIDEASERAWVADLLATIAELNNVVMTTHYRELLESTLDIFVRTPKENRSLSTFIPKLADRTGELRMALQQYTVAGALEGILDGSADQMSDAAFQVYELSNIIGGDNKERVLVPVMLVLFHMIQRKLRNNKRTFIAIDEAWSHFRSPAAQRHLDEALRTFRKLHAGVGLFTQNLEDIINSPLATTVMTACKTQIFLPNPLAVSTFMDFYRTLGLSSQQIKVIARATQKREYYFHSEDGSALIDLGLSRAELAIYARGGTDDLEEVRRMKASYPDSWREKLLRARGCEEAADRLAELNHQDVRKQLATMSRFK